MKNIYTLENMDGKVTTITSSHELSQSAVDAFMDSFGLSYNHAVEPFDRVEQTYKQVAEQLQVELDQIKRDTSAIEAAVLRRVADKLFDGVTSRIINDEADRIEKGECDD